jgi:hypothetical protein
MGEANPENQRLVASALAGTYFHVSSEAVNATKLVVRNPHPITTAMPIDGAAPPGMAAVVHNLACAKGRRLMPSSAH